jgi:hypothetical protein
MDENLMGFKGVILSAFRHFCSQNYLKVLNGELTEKECNKLIDSKTPYTFIYAGIISREELNRIQENAQAVDSYMLFLDSKIDEAVNKKKPQTKEEFESVIQDLYCEEGIGDIVAKMQENIRNLKEKYQNET